MEKVLVFSLLVLASLRSASTEMFIKEGGSVTLDLRPAPLKPITIVQWKFKDSILAEWVKGVVPLTHNRDNIKLDIVSGRLAMEKMTKADHEGVYSVEVNNNVQKVTYNVVFINDVPKPSIWVSPISCSDADDQCTLKCEGNTTAAEPVTYSWKTDNGEWKESRRDMPITQEVHGQVKTFTCKMKNPVSEEESDLFTNRLYTEKKPDSTNPGSVIGIVVAVLVAIGVGVGLWLFWARKNQNWPFGTRIIDPEAPAGNVTASNVGANEMLLNGISTTNISPDAEPGSQEGPAGGADPPNPSHEEKPSNPPHEEEPVSKDELTGEPADPPKASREENTDIENAAAEGEADASQ